MYCRCRYFLARSLFPYRPHYWLEPIKDTALWRLLSSINTSKSRNKSGVPQLKCSRFTHSFHKKAYIPIDSISHWLYWTGLNSRRPCVRLSNRTVIWRATIWWIDLRAEIRRLLMAQLQIRTGNVPFGLTRRMPKWQWRKARGGAFSPNACCFLPSCILYWRHGYISMPLRLLPAHYWWLPTSLQKWRQ